MQTAVEDIMLWPPKRNKASYNRSLFSLFLGCLYYAALACAWIARRMDSHGHKCLLESELFSIEVELSWGWLPGLLLRVMESVFSQVIALFTELFSSGLSPYYSCTSHPSHPSAWRLHYLGDAGILTIIIHKNMHLQVNGEALCMLLYPGNVFEGIFNTR